MTPRPTPRNFRDLLPPDDLPTPRPRKSVPFAFVLDTLAPLSPRTRPMFGCTAVYIGEKIMIFLRDKPGHTAADNGVWIATTDEHHTSLRRDFPSMRPIRLLDGKITGWQNLPSDSPDFEQATLHLCDLIARRDPRIGKIPKPKRSASPKPRTGRKL